MIYAIPLTWGIIALYWPNWIVSTTFTLKYEPKILSILTITIVLSACGGSEDGYVGDGYDRGVLLTNITDNIIIPAYENFSTKLNELENLKYF